MKKRKYIFITGGVLSSVGKGICASSIGMLMERRGIKVTMVKMDPYLNIDPGTMSPVQHGEVFVLDDGSETDLDLGHYSRFVQNAKFTRKNSFTTGRVYDAVLRRERSGGYLGKTVQVIPHITDEIKACIRDASIDSDLAICEVGGTVGDIESQPFLEAIRQLKHEEGAGNVLVVHVTLVPYIASAGELKTKPTQHSVKELRSIGLQPDMLVCRADRKLPKEVKEKIGLFCNVTSDCVFSGTDVPHIYEVPLRFHEEGLDEKIVEKLGIWTGRPDLDAWRKMVHVLEHPKSKVRIALVGKYLDTTDSYKSLSESLVHAGVANEVAVEIDFIDSEQIEKGDLKTLSRADGILVPGGFGERGVEGKIKAIEHARKNRIPFFGICLGMQLAVVEFARHVAGMTSAHSEEFKPEGTTNVVGFLASQRGVSDKGGTMRLGAYPCRVTKEIRGKPTKAWQAYGSAEVSERHRHRLEVADQFRAKLEEFGLLVTGRYVDAKNNLELVEMVELADHPWFLGCQFHPEFLSRPLQSHPLFSKFIEASRASSEGRESRAAHV